MNGQPSQAQFESNPANRQAFQALEREYSRQRRWEELAGLYERHLKALQNGDLSSLWVRLAEIYLNHLRESQKALRCYRRAVESNPQNINIIKKGWRLALGESSSKEIVFFLEKEIALEKDPLRKSSAYNQMGQIYLRDIKDLEKARESFKEALLLDGKNRQASAGLEKVLEELGDYRNLARFLQMRAKKTEELKEKKNLLHRLAQIQIEKREDMEGGGETLLQIYHLDPEDPTPLRKIEKIAQAHQCWDLLLRASLARAEHLGTTPEAIRFWMAAAVLCETELDDMDRALKYYHQILEIDPHHQQTLNDLRQIYRQQGQWKKLAKLLEKEAQKLEGKEKGRALEKVGKLFEKKLSQSHQALNYYRQALHLGYDSARFLNQVEGLARSEDDGELILEVLDLKLDRATADEMRYQLLSEKGKLLCESLDRPSQGREAWEKARELFPRRSAPFFALEDLLKRQEKYEDLAQLYREEIERSDEDSRRARLLSRLATIEEEHLHLTSQALEHYRQSLELLPGQKEILPRLLQLARQLNATGDLATFFTHQMDLLEGGERVSLHLDLGKVLWNDGQRKEAWSHYKEARSLDPQSEEILKWGQEMAWEEERWNKVEEIINHRLALASSSLSLTLDLHFQKAKLAWEKLEDLQKARRELQPCLDSLSHRPKALQYWEEMEREGGDQKELARVLERKRHLPLSHRERVNITLELAELYCHFEEWEKGRELYGEVLAFSPQEEKALEALEKIFRRDEASPQLAELLLQRSYMEESRERELQREGAEIYEKCGEISQACQIWARLSRAYGEVEDLRHWKKLALELDRPEEIEEALALLVGKEEKREDLEELARFYDDKERYEEGVEIWKKILSRDKKDRDVLQKVLHYYRQREEWSEVAFWSEEELQLVESVKEEREKRKDLIGLYRDKLGLPRQSLPHYRSLLDSSSLSEEALEEMVDLYKEEGEYEEAQKILELMIQKTGDEEQKYDYLWQSGRLYEESQLFFDRARRRYEEAFRLFPRQEGREKIKELLRHMGRFPQLANWLKKELKEDLSREAKSKLHYELAQLYHYSLDQPQEAIDHYTKALELEGSQPDLILEPLLHLCQIEEEWSHFERIIENYSQSLTSEEKARNYYHLGEVFREREDFDRARQYYRESLGHYQKYWPSWDSLADLNRHREDWEGLLELYKEKMELLSSPSRRCYLYMERARIWEEKIGDKTRARSLYEKLLQEEDSENIPALQALADSYQREGNREGEIEVLNRHLELAGQKEKVPLLLRLGQLVEDRVRAEKLFKEALEIDPANYPVLLALEEIYRQGEKDRDLYRIYKLQTHLDLPLDRQKEIYSQLLSRARQHWSQKVEGHQWAQSLLKLNPTDREALDYLRHYYEKEEKWEKFTELTLREIDLSTTGKRTKGERYKELGEVWEERDRARAIEFYEGAQSFLSEDREVFEALQSLYRKEQQWEKLAELYRNRLFLMPSRTQELLDLHLKLGLLLKDRLQRPEEAREEFKAVLQIDPTHLQAKYTLEKLLREEERWKELSALYLNFIEYGADNFERSDYYFKLGVLLEKKVGKRAQAFNCYRRTLSLNPVHKEALDRLIERAVIKEDYPQALEYLEVRLKNISDSQEERDLRRQAAQIWEENLQHRGMAIRHYQRILSLYPEDEEALTSLLELFHHREDWNHKLEILARLVDVVEDDFERGQYLIEMAETAERKGDLPSALEYSELALDFLPLTRESAAPLLRLYRDLGEWEKLAELYGDLLDNPEIDEDLAYSYHCERGRVLWKELGRAIPGLAEMEKAYQIYSDSTELAQSLKELYRTLGHYDRLVSLLERELELTEDHDSRLALWKELGRTYKEHLYLPDRARKAYQQALDIDSRDREVLEALDALWEKEENYSQLLEIRRRRAEEEEDQKKWIKLQKSRAEILYYKLDMEEKALEVYREIRHRDEGAIFKEEREILEKLGQREEQIALLLRQAEETEAPLVKADLLTRAGELELEKSEGGEKSLEIFKEALEADPSYIPALRGLRQIYRQGEEWDKFEEVALEEAELLLGEDPLEAALLYTQLGEQKLAQKENSQAVDHFKKAISLDKTARMPLLHLREIYEKAKKYEKVLPLLDRESIIVEDPEDKAALLVRKGKILLNLLDRPEKARETFEKALSYRPHHKFALRALGDLHFESSRWKKALSCYTRLLDALDKKQYRQESLQATYRTAVCHRHLQEEGIALRWYEKTLNIDSDFQPALAELASLHRESGESEKALPLLRHLLEKKEEKGVPESERLPLYREVAQTLKELGKRGESIYYLEKILAQREKDRESLEEMARLHREEKNYEDALAYYHHALRASESPEEKSQLYCEIGQTHRERKKFVEAASSFHRAIEISPQNPLPRKELVEVTYENKMWDQVIDYFPSLIEEEKNPQKKSQYHYYLGTAHFEGRGDYEKAKEAFSQSLALDGKNMNVVKAKALVHSLRGEWEEMARSYETLLENFPGPSREKIPLHLKLGDLYAKKLENLSKAQKHYEEVLEFDAHNPAAHSALAHLYLHSEDQLQKALRENLYLLENDPFLLAPYHRLVKIFDGLNTKSRLKQSLSILHLLEDLTERERERFQEVKKLKKSLSIDESIWSRYLQLSRDHQTLERIFTLITPHMERAYPPQLEELGLNRREALPRSSQTQPMKILNQFESVFAPIEVDIYLLRQKKPLFLLENTSPPSLVLSTGCLSLFEEEELAHILSFYFSHILTGRYLVNKLGPDEFTRLFSYLAALFGKEVQIPGLTSEDIQIAVREIKSSLPRRIRREMEGEIEEYWLRREEFLPSFYYQSIFESGHRFGLVLTQQIEDSARALYKLNSTTSLEEGLDTQGRLAQLQSIPFIGKLFYFAVSEEFSIAMA